MRRLAACLLVLLCLSAGQLSAQTLPQVGPLIAVANTITANPAPASSIAFQVVGTFVGTITFEATSDGTNYVSLLVTSATTGLTSTTATTTGVFTAANGGYQLVRARASAWTSGRADISIIQGYGQAKVASPQFSNVYLGDGTAAAPSLTFVSDIARGWYKFSATSLGWVGDLTPGTANTYDVGSSANPAHIVYVATSLVLGSSPNNATILADAANALACRNGTNACEVRVYNTFTDASNYEFARFLWSANLFRIETTQAGTGTARNILIGTNGAGTTITFNTNGSNRWGIDANANLVTVGSDNALDIGASGATRPRNIYVGTSINAPSYSLALSQAEPVDQTARSSSGGTFVMMGLGAAAAPCTVTPTSTGRVYFVITGDIVNNTTATTVSIKMAENTGSAPANNAAATGTVISRTVVTNAVTSVLTTPFTLTATKTGLALNTAVWFDLQLTTSGANTGQPTNIDCTAHEI